MSPAKTAEEIDMPFKLSTRVGPGNRVLDVVHVPMGRGNYNAERAARCKV